MYSLLKNPLYRFLLIFLCLIIGWFLLYNLWLHPHSNLDLALVTITLEISEWVLQGFGYDAFVYGRTIHISGSSGLWMGDSCNAMPLFALFAGFVLAFPGPWKRKTLFVLLGIISIFILNCIRVIVLTILDTHSREWTEFNHTYTFNIIIYGYIFLMWILWAEKFSGRSLASLKPTGNEN